MLQRLKRGHQFLLSILAVSIASFTCYWLSPVLGYRVVAYVLLITVSLTAMLFDILPVLVAAALSALIWDFFFIPPHFTLQVGSAEDSILLSMYFVIAMVNAVLMYKIRQAEKVAREREEKQNAVKLYNTLLNSLSHELRTPISTIIGATDNLQTGGAKLTAENRFELVNEISKASFRLNQQVDNLLNMSRIESGIVRPKSDWCDVNEIVYDTVKRIEDSKIPQRITVNINPDMPLVKLDEGMLEQVIYNLLLNATLYTPPDAEIQVSGNCHADVLELIISDNGPGFPKDEIEQVFDKFYRLKNTRAGGTGLGLSIVKGFTEAMGGSISLSNAPTGGAVFTIQIPSETSYLKNFKND